jgi:hypothetical protein
MTNFQTAQAYIDHCIDEQCKNARWNAPFAEVLDLIRTLPREEAVELIEVYIIVCDSERGGSWEDAYGLAFGDAD